MKNKKKFENENIIIILVGVASSIIGVLILLGLINPESYGENKLVPILVILMGVIAIINGSLGQIRKRKYKDSVYYKLLDDLNNGLIEEKLSKEGIENVDITSTSDSITVKYSSKKGEMTLVCYKQNLIFDFVYDKEYLLSLEEEKRMKLQNDNISENYDGLDIKLDEIYIKFATLVKLRTK